MTKYYIGTKQILAWPQDKDGAPGYAVTVKKVRPFMAYLPTQVPGRPARNGKTPGW